MSEPITIDALNQLDQDEFVGRLGGVFEDSPWIMAETWTARPFASIDDLHAKAMRIVNAAPPRRQTVLILAHPDLVGRAAQAGTLTPASTAEQRAAGLDPGALTADEVRRFEELNDRYKERFGFPFVICVRDHDKASILAQMERRAANDEMAERRIALGEIAKIARYRLADAIVETQAVSTPPAPSVAPPVSTTGSSAAYQYEVSYGKAAVPVYRVKATPLTGVPPIPESSFTGRTNILLAAEIDVEVIGDNFLPAYTVGDNSMVVATDSMKNLVIREAVNYEGATLEGYLAFLGEKLLGLYPQMQRLRLTARELPFSAATVPGAGGFGLSDVLFDRGRGDYSTATLLVERNETGGLRVLDHQVGLRDLMLMKTTGSAFTAFVRDDYTTLPERRDRPLYIHLNLDWRYTGEVDLLDLARGRYVPPEQVRDLVKVVFHEFVSESIQHLQHEMGRRLLERFPQLLEVHFEGRNLTRDPWAESTHDPSVRVYSDPFNAYGRLTLTMRRAG